MDTIVVYRMMSLLCLFVKCLVAVFLCNDFVAVLLHDDVFQRSVLIRSISFRHAHMCVHWVSLSHTCIVKETACNYEERI